MKINRLQVFETRNTFKMIKVTKIHRNTTGSHAHDLCLIKDIVNGQLVAKSGRYVLADSIRRKYFLVA